MFLWTNPSVSFPFLFKHLLFPQLTLFNYLSFALFSLQFLSSLNCLVSFCSLVFFHMSSPKVSLTTLPLQKRIPCSHGCCSRGRRQQNAVDGIDGKLKFIQCISVAICATKYWHFISTIKTPFHLSWLRNLGRGKIVWRWGLADGGGKESRKIERYYRGMPRYET